MKMSRSRGQLAVVAMVWMAIQVTSLASIPVRAYTQIALPPAVDTVEDCGMAPGSYCPMHKHFMPAAAPPSAPGECQLKPGCTPDSGALPLSMAPAVLPISQAFIDDGAGVGRSRQVTKPLALSKPPVSPPPRS